MQYGVFFYLFMFIILKDIEKIEQFENSNIKILKNISLDLLEGNSRKIEDGIWNLLNNYKTIF